MKTKLLLLLLLANFSIYAQTANIPVYVPKNGLVAYYPFNGNANDTNGNGSNGTVTAATLTSDRFGNNNTAYSFDGVNSYIDAVIPNIPQNNSSRTISGWFQSNTPNYSQNNEVCVFNYGTLSELKRFSLCIYSKGYLETVSGPNFTSGDFYVDNFNYLNNDWYFFTLTYDGNKVSLYVNGMYVSEKAVSLSTTNNLFRIGKRISGDINNEYFKGKIDDIAIWNRVLTPEEISALYTPGKPEIAYTLIPDSNFEQKLINLGIDTDGLNGKVPTSNISTVKFLDLTKSNISDLTGVQDFVSLTDLYCSQNSLTTINVSKNIALTTLDCNSNRITSLDVSNNIALLNLICYSNQLTVLDVRVNTALAKLDSGSNKYTALDVSSNTALTFLGCNTSQLTSLDVSKNTALNLLDCRENKLTQLNVSKITTLTELYCQSNQLTNLNISENKALEFLNCSKNQLTTLDISVNTALVGLYSNSNQLTSLNLKNGKNSILNSGFNITNNPNLTCIQVDDVAYANTNWSAKKDATASFNVLCDNYTLIPDTNFEQRLIQLGIDTDGKNGKVLNSSISKIDYLPLDSNSIKDLTGIGGFTSLRGLRVSNNLLTNLDLSKNTLLDTLDCSKNKLLNLNIKNGNNSKFYKPRLKLSDNPDLTCIQVDDDAYSNVNWADIKDATASYNKNCSIYTAIPDTNFEQKLIDLGIDKDGLNGKISGADISSVTYLDLSNSNITDLSGIKDFTALTYLDCNFNNIKTIDVSENKLLTKLALHGNQLTSLDVTANTQLYNLTFSMNQISTIDLSQNKNLHYVIADRNLLTNIDVSANTELETIYCGDNKLTEINVSTLQNLTFLDCGFNNISALNVSNNKKLESLYCYNMQLTSLNLSQNVLLKTLNASANQLTTLDLSHNPLLTLVFLELNPLTSLNVQNGNNVNFILPPKSGKNASAGLSTSFLNNKNLSCIQVDNVDFSNANWTNIKEPTATYSSTCKSLGLEDSVFDKVVVYPNPTKGEININNATLEKATVYNTLGQLVRSFTLSSTNTNHKIDLTGLPKGVYYVFLINQDAASAKKVIVE